MHSNSINKTFKRHVIATLAHAMRCVLEWSDFPRALDSTRSRFPIGESVCLFVRPSGLMRHANIYPNVCASTVPRQLFVVLTFSNEHFISSPLAPYLLSPLSLRPILSRVNAFCATTIFFSVLTGASPKRESQIIWRRCRLEFCTWTRRFTPHLEESRGD